MRVDKRVFTYLVRQYQRSRFATWQNPVYNFVHLVMALSKLGHGLPFRVIGLHFGYPGSVNDARVFQNSPVRTRIEQGGINNYVLVGDAAYGLRPYIYTPYRATSGRHLQDEQRIWNLQQSRARMVVEQVNGRLKTKWRLLDGRIECDIFRAPRYVAACVTLHNIDLVLGARPLMEEPRERNRWWQQGPAATAPHYSPEHEGFTLTRRSSRLAGYLYASWCLVLLKPPTIAGIPPSVPMASASAAAGRREWTPRFPRSELPARAPAPLEFGGDAPAALGDARRSVVLTDGAGCDIGAVGGA
ncbi:unnamed protein product [Closterium sp. Yama58-4]|nr:unnamed protein product [Closterium sp. Yama58-4]